MRMAVGTTKAGLKRRPFRSATCCSGQAFEPDGEDAICAGYQAHHAHAQKGDVWDFDGALIALVEALLVACR